MATKSSTLSSEPLAEVSLTLLTWNINKGFPKDVSSGGSANRRDILIPIVLKDLAKQLGKKPDVVLLQESTIEEETARTRWGLSDKYRQQKENDKLRLGIDTTLGVKEMNSLSKQIDKLVPEGKTNDKDALKKADKDAKFSDDIIVDDYKDRKVMRSDIPPKAFARKLEVSLRETKIEVIVVSFHSVYRVTDDKKKQYIKLFFNLMCRLAQVHNCLVLVGADFNLNVGDWWEEIEKSFNRRVKVAKTYQPTRRRDSHNIIDTFAAVYPPVYPSGRRRVRCTLSKPTAVYPLPKLPHPISLLLLSTLPLPSSSCSQSLPSPPPLPPPILVSHSQPSASGSSLPTFLSNAFPDQVRRDGDQFKVVRFTEPEEEKLKTLLLDKNHKTSHGEPDWDILKCDLDHDPVLVTVTLD